MIRTEEKKPSSLPFLHTSICICSVFSFVYLIMPSISVSMTMSPGLIVFLCPVIGSFITFYVICLFI